MRNSQIPWFFAVVSIILVGNAYAMGSSSSSVTLKKDLEAECTTAINMYYQTRIAWTFTNFGNCLQSLKNKKSPIYDDKSMCDFLEVATDIIEPACERYAQSIPGYKVWIFGRSVEKGYCLNDFYSGAVISSREGRGSYFSTCSPDRIGNAL